METTYEPKIFHELDDLEIAEQHFQKNREKLTYLGDVICHYNLHEIVGICLLHKHFELQQNERVVREFIDNNFYIKPQIEPNWDCVTPYSWKIQKNHLEGFSYYPLEFFRHTGAGIEIKNRSKYMMSNSEFLVDIAIKLSELHLTNIFGIAILFDEFIDLEKGKFLLETTDDNRLQMFELSSAISLGSEIATQTLWKFTPQQKSNQSLFWKFLAQK